MGRLAGKLDLQVRMQRVASRGILGQPLTILPETAGTRRARAGGDVARLNYVLFRLNERNHCQRYREQPRVSSVASSLSSAYRLLSRLLPPSLILS